MKHTKGKLTVKPANAWPFDLVTFNEKNIEVFRRGMPAHSTEDKSFDDCLNAVNWDHSEREEIKEAQVIAYNDERLRAKSPEMLEALKGLYELRSLIYYPEDTRPEHANEALAVHNAMTKIESIIKDLE